MKKEIKMQHMINFFKDEEGATAIEYGLLAALIAVAIITTVGLVGTEINNVFTVIKDKLAAAVAG